MIRQMQRRAALAAFVFLLGPLNLLSRAETAFFEAEKFVPSSAGWATNSGDLTRLASGHAALFGAEGPGDATADQLLTVATAGTHRIWVRYFNMAHWRGPFRLAVLAGGKEIAGQTFDLQEATNAPTRQYAWNCFDADLPAGAVVLRLSKYKNENCCSYARYVDCVFVTTDLNQVPNHLDYAKKTHMRVTLGPGYDRPVQIHSFTPFAGHFHFSKAGIGTGTGPAVTNLLASGEATPWCDITPMLHPTLNVGGRPIIDARYTYYESAPFLRAKFEFATAPDANAIVRTYDIDYRPGTLYLVMPEDLATSDNLAKFKSDMEIAAETGKIADSFAWPAIGRKPRQFLFFNSFAVSEQGDFACDARVAAREWKTLDYFGYVNRFKRHIGGGLWHLMKENSYCSPDVGAMQRHAAGYATNYFKTGAAVRDIAYCMLTDEPTGQEAAFMEQNPAYGEKFRDWLKGLGKTPADLLVNDWSEVAPVSETNRDAKPALHYYTQRFRTKALGDYLLLQGRILKAAYGADFPVLVNFSDGATYYANFFGQGVDYFELLDDPGQNAIWGECGGALASTYQCTAYNIDLMRAAARKHGQTIGHYLIDYGRTPWDGKCKALSGVARGVKIYHNYFYGPTWGNYEGGPAWASGAWYAHPEKWYGNAELLREIGAAEDMLVPAKIAPAQVAILYSTATDAWTMGRNYAYGFDRMHIWLALCHAQVPVDIVSEKQAEEGLLDEYKVCYLCGPNLARGAAGKLAAWVRRGGILYATAGAGMRDEYNRPLDTLDSLMPAQRTEAQELDQYLYYGSALWNYPPRDTVRAESAALEALLVRQALVPRADAVVTARFTNGAPAIVEHAAGRGRVTCAGFLPGLAYARPAIVKRRALAAQREAAKTQGTGPDADPAFACLQRSDNPWEFPAEIREAILRPVRAAGVEPPIACGVPLVDAVYMTCPTGVLIPLANYTLTPQDNVPFTVRASRFFGRIERIESVHCGEIPFKRARGRISFTLPRLESTDFLKLFY
jgi:hypothetical protein